MLQICMFHVWHSYVWQNWTVNHRRWLEEEKPTFEQLQVIIVAVVVVVVVVVVVEVAGARNE